jgi:hypothetical protein
MLGKATDQDIAKKIGCAPKTVEKRRKKLRIESYRKSGHKSRMPQRIDWPEWDMKLGKSPDGKLAEIIGCSVCTVEKRRKKLRVPAFMEHPHIEWPDWDGELGKTQDWQAAKLIGCSLVAVEQRRKRIGVKSFTKNDRVDWNAWDYALGKASDRETAEMIGCSAISVRRRRKKLGIEAFFKRKEENFAAAGAAKGWSMPLDNAAVTI